MDIIRRLADDARRNRWFWLAVVLAFGLLVWPGYWRYTYRSVRVFDSNHTMRIDKLTGHRGVIY